MNITCKKCGCDQIVKTRRRFAVCPYCKTRTEQPEPEYREIDWNTGMYASAVLRTDCPACRSPNMYLGAEKKKWRCPDCGYTITDKEKNSKVFWFCDDCETFLNIQKGFTTKTGNWTCTECGYQNDVTEDNII